MPSRRVLIPVAVLAVRVLTAGLAWFQPWSTVSVITEPDGKVKGNVGNVVYPIPEDVDLSRLTSVTIWCDRFDVSFGAAQLVRSGN
jgi:hypothetical protein